MTAVQLKTTPAPWRWEVNKEYKTVYLKGGCPRFDQNVMSFTRWGMGGAAPEFRGENENHSIIHRVEKWAVPVPGREHHAHWFMDVNHPDARLMRLSPNLKAVVENALPFLVREQQFQGKEGQCPYLDEIIEQMTEVLKEIEPGYVVKPWEPTL